MYEVVPTAVKDEGRRECKVGGSAGVEVECQDGGWVGDHSLDFDGVNKRFGESGGFKWAIIEAVDVIPD